jgi:hypothetical protein
MAALLHHCVTVYGTRSTALVELLLELVDAGVLFLYGLD